MSRAATSLFSGLGAPAVAARDLILPRDADRAVAGLGERLGGWHLAVAGVLVAAGVVATLPAWADIFARATLDPEYSHIFTVPLVALWLIYVRRARIRRTRPTGQMVGVAVTAAGWIITTLGFYRGIEFLWHAGAVVVAVGCALSVLGKNVLFHFLPAVVVMAFMVPVPGRIRQAIAVPLQTWTASTTEAVLGLAGANVEASGNTLAINGKMLTVAEACNGIRMVFALTLVCYALAFALPLRNSVRALILLLSPGIALLCNIIRTVPTVMVYARARPEFADAFHDYAGWMMLPLAFGILYLLIRTLRWAHLPVQRYTLASQ